MSEIIKLLDSRFVTDRDVRVTRALVSLDEYSQLKQRITELEQQLKTAKADGAREYGAYYQLAWESDVPMSPEEYANNLEGK